jgi:hypothetical protein
MSKAEELTSRILSYGFECEAGPLANCAEFQELIAALAQRDERIAELMRGCEMGEQLARDTRAMRDARAEVPEWCKEFVAAIARDWDSFELLETAARVVNEYADQLRACGIDVT